jgi:hypothetical protein
VGSRLRGGLGRAYIAEIWMLDLDSAKDEVRNQFGKVAFEAPACNPEFTGPNFFENCQDSDIPNCLLYDIEIFLSTLRRDPVDHSEKRQVRYLVRLSGRTE